MEFDYLIFTKPKQGRIQDLIGGGGPDCDRPKLPTVRSSIMQVE